MRAVTALVRLGGTATRQQLRLAVVHWRHVDAALEAGLVVRTSRGHYCLPGTDEARAAASRLSGAASHTTAALHWGWKVRRASEQAHVTVRAKRSLPEGASDGVLVHWRDLEADDVTEGWVTTPVRTVIDCCLDLPFADALSVADSARRGGLRPSEVLARSAWLPRRQRDRVARVIAASDSRAKGVRPGLPPLQRPGDPRLARAAVHVGTGDVRAGVVRRATEDVVALRRREGVRRLRTGRVTGSNRRKAS